MLRLRRNPILRHIGPWILSAQVLMTNRRRACFAPRGKVDRVVAAWISEQWGQGVAVCKGKDAVRIA